MAWISPIVGDLDGALREASASLEEFRREAEPLGTTSAGLTLGSLETTVGRYDDALRHLTEARDLAARLDNAWLTATSQVLLGTLALVQGRLEDVQALLEEALDLSLAARSTQLVTLCLAGFARLAFVEGNAERAALLAGAAEDLRRRVGLRAWPSHRRAEAALVDQIRRALGADRFDQAFAAGARLSQREAVAAAQSRRGAGTRAS
jgi:tetratricopeptide (TPR) repeat protein